MHITMHTLVLLTLLPLLPRTLASPLPTANPPLLPDNAKSPPPHCLPPHCSPIKATYNYTTGHVTILHESSFYDLPISLTSEHTLLPLHPSTHPTSTPSSIPLPATISYAHTQTPLLSLPHTARTLFELGRIPSPSVYITQRFIAFGGFEPIMFENLPVRVFNGAARAEPVFIRMNNTLSGAHRGWELTVAAELDLRVAGVEVPRSYAGGRWGMMDMGIEMDGPFVEADAQWRIGRKVLETTVLLAVYNANGTLLHQNRRLLLPSMARGVIVPYYDPGHAFALEGLPRWGEKRAAFALLKSGRATMGVGARVATVVILIVVLLGVFVGGCWGYVHVNKKRWDRDSAKQRLLFGWYMPRWAVRTSLWREI